MAKTQTWGIKDPHIPLRSSLHVFKQWSSSLAALGITRGAYKAPQAGGPHKEMCSNWFRVQPGRCSLDNFHVQTRLTNYHLQSMLSCFSSVQLFTGTMDCSPPGSPVHGIFQARILERVVPPPPGDLLNPGIKPESPLSFA